MIRFSSSTKVKSTFNKYQGQVGEAAASVTHDSFLASVIQFRPPLYLSVHLGHPVVGPYELHQDSVMEQVLLAVALLRFTMQLRSVTAE